MTRKQAIAAVDRGDATFQEWFVGQFGPEPSEVSIVEVRAAEAKAHRLRQEYDAWQLRQVVRNAALMAWTAACALQAKQGDHSK